MLQMLRFLIITAVLVQAAFISPAQATSVKHGKPVPKWVSEKGYWVIESNKDNPRHSIIYYYRKDNHLVYKETFSGQVINTNRKKVKMRLKETLEKSIENFEQTAWRGGKKK